jgi:nucleoside 2-deoxyribosyltransferase
MTKDTFCWFTGAKAQRQSHPSFDAIIFQSEACDIYTISHELKYHENFRKVREGQPPDVRQGEINCARKCLEVRKDGFTAFWVERDQADAYRASIAKLPRSNHVVCIYDDVHSEPVDHSEKPYVLLERFAEKLTHDRAFSQFNITVEDQLWARICDANELTQIAFFLRNNDLLSFQVPTGMQGFSEVEAKIYQVPMQMTVKGWQEVRSRNVFPNTNKVFIATQFQWPEEDAVRAEAIEAIKRACRSCGYEAEVVGQDHTGNITDRIIAEIRRAQFVVAELTYNNRGVYFESGFARGIGRHVFHVVREGFTSGDDKDGKRIHFDIQQVMYRTWKQPNDLEATLRNWIEAAIGMFGKTK